MYRQFDNITGSVRCRLLKILTDPFVRTPGLMLLLIVMQTVIPYQMYVQLCPERISDGACPTICVILLDAAVYAWIALLIYNLLRGVQKAVGRVWLGFCLVIFTANWLIDFALLHIYKQEFTRSIAAALIASNPDESVNFVATYADTDMLTVIGIYATGFVGVYIFGAYILGKYLRRKLIGILPVIGKYIRVVLSAIMLACIVVFVCSNSKSVVHSTNLTGKCVAFAELDLGHEIEPQHPRLRLHQGDIPSQIVLIIGESHSRSHSSLYGYSKQTQPQLEQLAADSMLCVFRHPMSPGLHTMESLQKIIGTYNGETNRHWYDCVTLLEVANLAGYRTIWLSNQSNKGFHEDPIVKMAQFCNVREFTDNNTNGYTGYDGELLSLLDKYLPATHRTLTILHLQGSHVDYNWRYPSEYGHFKPTDYPDSTAKQQKILAAYDNSILYNDYVVSSVMKRFENTDAIVIYLSDHAQDLFESSAAFFGHGKEGDRTSMYYGAAIPFYVYMSPTFKTNHSALVSRIYSSANKAFNLTDLIYTMMDIMGASFADNNDVETRSLFRQAAK